MRAIERGRRAGTENSASIVALGKACEQAMEAMHFENTEVKRLREAIEARPFIGPYPIIVPQPPYVPQPWWVPPQYTPITWTCTTSTPLPGEPT